jgi:hypothetical protein
MELREDMKEQGDRERLIKKQNNTKKSHLPN